MVLLETVDESGDERQQGVGGGLSNRVLQRASRVCMYTHVCSERWTNYRNLEPLGAG
jgi:hypothetical protein